MKKFIITAALAASFVLLCFSWVIADGTNDGEGHTWDERSNGIIQPPGEKSFTPSLSLLHLGKWTILIWKETAQTDSWKGSRLGKYSYSVIRAK